MQDEGQLKSKGLSTAEYWSDSIVDFGFGICHRNTIRFKFLQSRIYIPKSEIPCGISLHT